MDFSQKTLMDTPEGIERNDLNADLQAPADYLSLQSKKNIVLVSHGRPPW